MNSADDDKIREASEELAAATGESLAVATHRLEAALGTTGKAFVELAGLVAQVEGQKKKRNWQKTRYYE